MDACLPDDVSVFFSAYLQHLQAVLPTCVYGCYLYGSIAFGAYDPRNSDLDFMIVLTRPLDDSEIKMITELHAWLCHILPLTRRLDGYFVPLSAIRQQQFTTGYPYFRDGVYIGLHGVMTLYWHQLEQTGLCLAGPSPASIFPPVSWDDIRQEMDANLNGYWSRRAQKGRKEFFLNESVTNAVLTVCRILYTLEHRQNIGKVEAGQWGLTTLAPRWHQLIEEGLRIRRRTPRKSMYLSRWQRAGDICAFIVAMREFCNLSYFS